MCVCVCVYVFVYVCAYVCVFVCARVRVRVRMCVCDLCFMQNIPSLLVPNAIKLLIDMRELDACNDASCISVSNAEATTWCLCIVCVVCVCVFVPVCVCVVCGWVGECR